MSAMQIANQPKQADLTDPSAGTLSVTPEPGCLKGFRMSADFDDPLEGFDDRMLIQISKPGTIMTLSIQLPDHAAALLRNVWDDLPRAALESLAVEGYRSGRLSCAQAGELLGHSSRWESEEFLAAHGVWPGTTVEELESDLATLDRLRGA